MQCTARKRDKHIHHILIKKKSWFRPRIADMDHGGLVRTALTEKWYGVVLSPMPQQGWFVPHDVPGMVGVLMIGEKEKVCDQRICLIRLNQICCGIASISSYNEPVHSCLSFSSNSIVLAPTQKWTQIYLIRMHITQ